MPTQHIRSIICLVLEKREGKQWWYKKAGSVDFGISSRRQSGGSVIRMRFLLLVLIGIAALAIASAGKA